MQIDLFTLIAEIFNFFLLVFLLQRFLYRPIIRIMDEREKATVNRLKEAEEKRKEAEQEKRTYEEKVLSFEQEREGLLEEARQESKQQRQKLVDDAKDEVEKLRRNWREAVESEREAFLQDLRQQVGAEIVKSARTILHDMADQDLEERVVAVFIQRLSELDKNEKDKFAEAVKDYEHPVHVQTAFKLSDEARTRLDKALKPYLNEQKLKYEIDDKLLCGVRIATAEYEIAWTFDHYVNTLQQRFQQTLEENLREITDERGEKHAEQHPEEHADSV